MAKEGRRAEVPTLHYPNLSKWRREGNWDEWCVQRHEEDLQIDIEKHRSLRDRATGRVILMSDLAFDVWEEMLRDRTTPPTVRAKLIEMVKDTVIVKDDRKDEGEKIPASALPPTDATDEDKRRWLQLVSN